MNERIRLKTVVVRSSLASVYGPFYDARGHRARRASSALNHTVTIDSYHMAAQAWWDRQNLYIGPSGFNYLPHFVILYSPFHFLPFTISEILWRWAAALALSAGLWRLASILFRSDREHAFFWMTLLAVPLCMAPLRNGNANAHFGGVMLLAIASFLESEWTAAVAWTALAIAIKPLAIVLLGLASLFYMPVVRRLPAAVFSLAIFPFLFGAPAYVWSQEQEAWKICAPVPPSRNIVSRTSMAFSEPSVSLLPPTSPPLFAPSPAS